MTPSFGWYPCPSRPSTFDVIAWLRRARLTRLGEQSRPIFGLLWEIE